MHRAPPHHASPRLPPEPPPMLYAISREADHRPSFGCRCDVKLADGMKTQDDGLRPNNPPQVNTTLTRLDMSNNPGPGDAGLEKFAQLLHKKHYQSLKTIILNRVNMSDKGLFYLTRTLCANHTLTTMHLARNRLGDAAAACIGTPTVAGRRPSRLCPAHRPAAASASYQAACPARCLPRSHKYFHNPRTGPPQGRC
jgi:hypothetical protein